MAVVVKDGFSNVINAQAQFLSGKGVLRWPSNKIAAFKVAVNRELIGFKQIYLRRVFERGRNSMFKQVVFKMKRRYGDDVKFPTIPPYFKRTGKLFNSIKIEFDYNQLALIIEINYDAKIIKYLQQRFGVIFELTETERLTIGEEIIDALNRAWKV